MVLSGNSPPIRTPGLGPTTVTHIVWQSIFAWVIRLKIYFAGVLKLDAAKYGDHFERHRRNSLGVRLWHS